MATHQMVKHGFSGGLAVEKMLALSIFFPRDQLLAEEVLFLLFFVLSLYSEVIVREMKQCETRYASNWVQFYKISWGKKDSRSFRYAFFWVAFSAQNEEANFMTSTYGVILDETVHRPQELRFYCLLTLIYPA